MAEPLRRPDPDEGRARVTHELGAKITACVLSYNHAHLIESTLMSILDQTVTGHEILVSDDCSTDGTWDIIVEMAKSHSSIVPIRTPANMGMAKNANFAALHCSRPYFAMLHHDDLYRRDLLEKWANVLERHPRAGFVFNRYRQGRSEPTAVPFAGEYADGRWFLNHVLLPRWGSMVRGTAMVRREAWSESGGMRPEFSLLADVDLWMRLCRDWDVGFVPEPLITVRQSRPSYYPEIYDGGSWSWQRQRILYEIHARNRLETLDLRSVPGRARWLWFIAKLNLDSAKWLMYGLMKGRSDVIETSPAGRTEFDSLALRGLRRLILSLDAGSSTRHATGLENAKLRQHRARRM